MRLTLTRHRGTDEGAYPDDPNELQLEVDRIEAVWEDTYRFYGRHKKTENVHTKILMYSGHVFEVKDTPKDIYRRIALSGIRR